jgi:hypothetical protein
VIDAAVPVAVGVVVCAARLATSVPHNRIAVVHFMNPKADELKMR